MYEQLCNLQESADISLPTSAHLERAHLELQARTHEAEASLATFYFDDAHFSQEDMSPTVRAASDRFRKFLKQFYEKEYQSWPVKKGQPGLWLDRTIASRLQEDFSALYEYGVDRTVTWNDDIDVDDRSKRYLLKSMNTQNMGLDAEDFRMLGVFQNLDCRLNASDIPYPYPLLPAPIPIPVQARKFVFRVKKQDKGRESRVVHAYAEASNASRLRREHAENELVKAFIRFEKADQPGEVDPREARRERWIIIYCTLQTVAGSSVDVPHLSFKGGVNYFLNARLHNLPPWKPEEKVYTEACREQSHCWTAPEKWANSNFNSLSSPQSFHSNARNQHFYDTRPLSPDPDPFQSFTFFESTSHTPSGDYDSGDSQIGANDSTTRTSGRINSQDYDSEDLHDELNVSISGTSTRINSHLDYESTVTGCSSGRYPQSSPAGYASSATSITEASTNCYTNTNSVSTDYRPMPAKVAAVAGISLSQRRIPLPLRPRRGLRPELHFPRPPRR